MEENNNKFSQKLDRVIKIKKKMVLDMDTKYRELNMSF